MAKKIYSKIMDTGLTWIVAVLGIPLTIYGMWFQTEGFQLISLYNCMLPAMIGGVIGLFIMNSLYNQSKYPEPGKKRVTIEGLKSMGRSYIFCFLICMLLVYRARVPIYFLIGLGGMALSSVTVLYYLIWRERDKRKKQVGDADIKHT